MYGYPSDYLLRTYSWLEHYNILPREGGLDTQDLAWVQAIETVRAIKNEEQHKFDDWLERKRKAENGNLGMGLNG